MYLVKRIICFYLLCILALPTPCNLKYGSSTIGGACMKTGLIPMRQACDAAVGAGAAAVTGAGALACPEIASMSD
jgi:hypothetical protein